MDNNGCIFPYDKAVVLNALYDALDGLSFVINRANSVRGTLFVSSLVFPEMHGQIVIQTSLTDNRTMVEVLTDDDSYTQTDWVDALLDEARSLIKKGGYGLDATANNCTGQV